MDLFKWFRRLQSDPPMPVAEPSAIPVSAQSAEPTEVASRPGPSDLPIESMLDLPEIYTLVPEAKPIALCAYYPHMRLYYVACEPQTKRWCVRNIARDWRIFDVGANIGYYSVLFGRFAREGRVAAYEPTATARMMERNLLRNGIDNVELHEVALGQEAGEIEAAIYRIWGEAPETSRYRFSTVDEEMRKLGWDRLDLLKIDVDSFDFDVLKGAVETLDRHDPWVLVKLNHALAKRGHSVGEVFDWLASQGYAEATVLDDENFLLRRGGKRRRLARAGLTIHFDREPVYLLPEWAVTEHVAADPAGPATPGPSGKIEGDGRVTIDGPTWSYGAILPMRPAGQGKAIVRLDLTVEGANVGVCCVGEGLSELLGREVFVSPGPTTRVEILLDRIEDCSAVVLCKAPGPNSPAIVRFGTPDVRLARAEGDSRPGISLDPHADSISLSEIASGLPDDRRVELLAGIPDDRLALVEAEALGARLGYDYAARTPQRVIDIPLDLFRMESHDARILAQIYRMHAPQRHLEFGTWEGFGAVLCARNCDAKIWTINLPDGETRADGTFAYNKTDAGEHIGRLYRLAGYTDRVTQFLCDSRDLDERLFGPGYFDSVLIDGGHSEEVVSSDTNKAIELVRSGGLIMWHDFCPDPAVLARTEAARGVVAAVLANWSRWRSCLDDLFWIRPSWILLGLRNGRRIER